MKIVIGGDHGAFALMRDLKEEIQKLNIEVIDVTDYENECDDYPDVAKRVCDIAKSENIFGIVSCKSGVGVSVTCNKIKGIIAGMFYEIVDVLNLRKHDDCNILVFVANNYNKKYVKSDLKEIVNIFVNTKCDEERHLRRVNKIKEMEK